MKINWIKFKVSTKKRKLKCEMCNSILIGKKGFIKMRTINYYGNIFYRFICCNCFDEVKNNIEKDRKKVKKMYKDLINRKIFRGLK